jgi:ribonuclease HI
MNKLLIYTDGGARGNPGPAACGIVIKNERNEIVCKSSKYLSAATNNQAEYEALVLALQKAKGIFKSQKADSKNLECYLDSELVVKHLNHQYKIKDPDLQPLFIKVWNLTLDFDSVKFIHIPREKNKLADELVNKELDNQKDRSLF